MQATRLKCVIEQVLINTKIEQVVKEKVKHYNIIIIVLYRVGFCVFQSRRKATYKRPTTTTTRTTTCNCKNSP